MAKKDEFFKVTSLNQLLHILDRGTSEFFILLNGGGKSWKTISFAEADDCNGQSKIEILNQMDDTRQILTQKNLFNERFTHIGKAIENGAFYYAWT